ncbi:hypothetical protein PsAD13_02104 [Pseudovibrio sp. Ad13]|uniref:hypothetical protein n=1 Tax=Pseudovibrio sp. Ad13 TaxID=989396 RepID=UPI0007B3011D|nr:hypothetical protein [Pseudovibrio sp. Ad13]KZK84639.1 hypothetical protein PsAD13_02104 [Pseudovibrio sp. Ad13]
MKRYRIGYVALPGFNESELGEMQAVLGINPLNRSSIIGATTKPVTGQHGLTLVPDRVFQDRTHSMCWSFQTFRQRHRMIPPSMHF